MTRLSFLAGWRSRRRTIPSSLAARHLLFLAICLLGVTAFGNSLGLLLSLAMEDDRYSHVIFAPLAGMGLVYLEKNRIFRAPGSCLKLGAPLIAAGIALRFAAAKPAALHAGSPDGLSVPILGVLLVVAGGFALCYGAQAFKAAAFPAIFLLLMIPLPSALIVKISLLLQAASAELAHWLFQAFGVPVFRQGFSFALPGVSIEVAEECSGIRSTITLIISSVLVAYLFLESGWKRTGFVVFAVFVAVFKNALRIVALACLAAYVDTAFLHGRLHHRYGGTVFSIVALAPMALLLLLLLRKNAPAKGLFPGIRNSLSGIPR
jgi:exosortase